MPRGTFSDATLLLIAHGSTVNAESAIAPVRHAAALENRDLFRDVRICFWKQPPFIRETVRAIQSPRVFAVPLFLSDGYFTSQIIPRELGLRQTEDKVFPRLRRTPQQTLFYTEPIGTSPRMTDVIFARANEVFATATKPPGASDIALVLAAHGTNKNSDSRRAAEWHAERLRTLATFAEVHTTFIEEEPHISNTTRITNVPNIVVVPFFISDGMHAREDLPILLGESRAEVQERSEAGEPTFNNPTARDGKLIWCSASVGTSPLVTEVILDRVKEITAVTAPDE